MPSRNPVVRTRARNSISMITALVEAEGSRVPQRLSFDWTPASWHPTFHRSPLDVKKRTKLDSQSPNAAPNDDGDLGEMLEEVRILLPGAQVLTAFLITLPFSLVFAQIVQPEKCVFTATFLCSTASLVLFGAPAVLHRLMRPLTNRVRFKHLATREILLGCIALSLALVLSTDLVVAEVMGERAAAVVAALIAALIGAVWWLLPWRWKAKHNV